MLVCLSFFGSLLLWLSNCEASHHISLSLPLFAPELIKHGNVVSCEFMVCCAACVHTGLCRIALSLPPCNRHADEITATLLRMTVIWGIFIKTATESVCVCIFWRQCNVDRCRDAFSVRLLSYIFYFVGWVTKEKIGFSMFILSETDFKFLSKKSRRFKIILLLSNECDVI